MNRRALAVLAVAALSACPHAPPPSPTLPPPPPPATPLVGFVDLHTHPVSNLGFSGKLMYGGNDFADGGGSLLPSDPDCNANVRALTLEQQLGHDKSTHGGFDLFHNRCGDEIRTLVISAVQSLNNANNPSGDAVGAPVFTQWPTSNDVTHQVMWVDSIRRAYDAGLRVMVTLAVNNTTLADIVQGPSDGPDDDQSSADLQITELKALVARHSDFMEIAYSPDDLQRIVAANHLAIVLGLEVDNIGNFNTRPGFTHDDVRREIARLRGLGVRYLFPIHLIDNPFGTTAAYQDIFNLSNLREAGHFWNLQCADPADQIFYRPTMTNPLRDPFSDVFTAEMAALMILKLHLFSLDDPSPPACPLDGGVVNRGAAFPGLTPDGEFAVQEMMRQCMLLDVDHMSQASANQALGIVLDAGYPINSGHNNVRSPGGGQTERQLTAPQYAIVNRLGGMAGVGSARVDHVSWVAESQAVLGALGDGGQLAFGTDSNGVSPLMPPPPAGAPPVVYSGGYPKSALGAASWDYNDAGVAHYGMISDFLQGVRLVDGGPELVDHLMHGAQRFHDTWQKAESWCAAFPPVDAGTATHHFALLSAPPACPEGTVFRDACERCLAPRERCPKCDELDGGVGCVREVPCPAGRTRNAWGVCSTQASLERKKPLDAPKLKAGGPGGKRLITFTAEGGKVKAFTVDLSKKQLTAGTVNRLWLAQWSAGDTVLMLVARPEGDAPLHGGFALHRPNARTVTGQFTLELPPKGGKPADPIDKLPAFLDQLR